MSSHGVRAAVQRPDHSRQNRLVSSSQRRGSIGGGSSSCEAP
jgi:hypothetical protein